jgi:hypothetical protein
VSVERVLTEVHRAFFGLGPASPLQARNWIGCAKAAPVSPLQTAGKRAQGREALTIERWGSA